MLFGRNTRHTGTANQIINHSVRNGLADNGVLVSDIDASTQRLDRTESQRQDKKNK